MPRLGRRSPTSCYYCRSYSSHYSPLYFALFSLELSERKAYTSALVRLRTADLVPLVQPGQPLYPLIMVSGGRYSAMGGGVPLASEGEVVAGVGVSGGTTEQDIDIVETAMK